MKTSVITYNRNDGYKETERFAIHLKVLLDTFDEVNYVDWNSPTRSFLYEVIDELPKTGRLKHFVVAPETHNFLFKDVPLTVPKAINNLAVNLAMRRTDADWIALTTSDNIPPLREELEEFIKNADKDTFYTFSRRDIEYGDVLNNLNNLTEYRKYLGTITEPRYFPAKVTPNDNYSLINCCGDFQFAPRKIWMDMKGTEEEMIYNCFLDTNIQKKAVIYGYKLVPIFDIPMYHMSHKNQLPQGGSTANLHKNAEEIGTPTYNDAWDWIENFTESQNTESWGFGDTEIEFEVF
jgi:hypothetical protein